MRYILYSFLLLFCGTVHAQLTVDNTTMTPKELTENVLVGVGVVPNNVIFNKSVTRATQINDQIGKWRTNGDAGNLGLESNQQGVLLTTGKATVALGPNNTGSATDITQLQTPIVQDDADLLVLSEGISVRNVSILEFDFIATGISVNFDYVFGSEEYPEYAPPIRNDYNDVFGFFISGPGINGPFTNKAENIALLTTTETASSVVSINNVNAEFNSQYYVKNGTGTTPLLNTYTQYDSFTTLLRATAQLQCGETYHIKLAIANVGDNGFDSGVFLKNFEIPPLDLNDNLGLSENKAVCYGETVVITTGGIFPAGYIYKWSRDGVPLPDNTPDLTVTTGGNYCVEVWTPAPNNCMIANDCIAIAYLPEIPFGNPINSSVCTPLAPPYSSAFNFNIDQTTAILNGLDKNDYLIAYYDSSYQDAYDGVPNGKCTIANGKFPNYSLTTASQTIWVHLESLIDGCVVVKSFTLDAFQNPTAPAASTIIQPTCTTPTGTIVVSSPLGAQLEYSIDGGTNYQASPSFSGLAQNAAYTIIAKNIVTSCVSVASNPVTVNAVPGAPATPTGTITQPTCAKSTGEIVITLPVGANFEYSIDGQPYVVSPTFSGLAANATYTIVAKDVVTGCISSPESFVINPLPTNPAAPTVSVSTQPTCTIPTGTVIVSAPLGATLEYSSGGTYQSSPTFAGLLPNTLYSFTVRDNVTGCVSLATAITINPIPGIPATPTATATQPTCAVNSGSITVNSPLGAIYEYGIDGVYQPGVTWTGLTAGKNYNITVREIATGCVSNIEIVTIGAALAVPVAPSVTVSAQPTCTTPTGTIEVTAPLGVNLQYSIDGINYQAGTTFANLTPNTTYNVNVKNIVSGCVSSVTSILVNAIPANPAAPIGSTTHPNCIVSTGTINITSPVGANYEYNNNGGIYQASTTFSGLLPNSVNNIIARDVNTGCVSTATTFTINAIPANPTSPVTSVTQPSCAVNTGTITVTSPLGAIYEYGIDGVYQSGVTFSGLTAGTNYSITVKEIATGCISSATIASVNPALNVPVAPTASVTFQPTCITPTGTITITAPIGANLEYSKDGITYQAGTIFNGLTPNTTYNITAKDMVSGCVSPITAVFVNAIPASPAAPIGTITQPNCYIPTGTILITSPVGVNFAYSIDNGVNYQVSTTFSGLAPNSTHTIIVKDIVTGCISLSTSFIINSIPPNPIAPLGNVIQPTCTVQKGRIDITNPLGVDLTYSIDAGVTYQQSKAFIDLAPNQVYSIIVKNIVTGCVSTASSFTINPIPTIPATPIASVDNNSPCETTSFNLSTPTVAGATYSWTGPNGFVSSIQNPSITNATSSMSGVYSVVIALVSDCPSLPGTVNVSVKPLPNPTLENGYVCVDGETGVVTNTYTLDSGLSNTTYSFEWYKINSGVPPTLIPSETSSTYVVDAPGTYGVIATNKSTTCVSELVTSNIVTSSPPTNIDIVSSDYFAEYQNITVNALPVGNYLYQIDNGAFQTSNVFDNVSSGEHKIVVKDSEGCGQIVGIVNTIDYPKFFTPNGDGYNDTWNIFTLSNQPNAKISIFDKYGKLIKQISPAGPGWDGSYNGKGLPSTDYWFNVDYKESGVDKVFRAHFTLKR